MDDFDRRPRRPGPGRGNPMNDDMEMDELEGGRGYMGSRSNRRACPFLRGGKCQVDYKDVDTLRRYVTDDGKIRPRRQTNVCSKCQRALATAVKRARFLALLPYTGQHVVKYGKD